MSLPLSLRGERCFGCFVGVVSASVWRMLPPVFVCGGWCFEAG
nr:MAG TPA: hypothetical protein [Siphoviridae sp. ctcOR4]